MVWKCKVCGGPMIYSGIMIDTTCMFMGVMHVCAICGRTVWEQGSDMSADSG